jgi:3-hydroxyacyl-CoA dehydrogenase
LPSPSQLIPCTLSRLTGKAVAKGKMDEASGAAHIKATMDKITPTTDLSALGECDIIIEAMIEDIALKEKLYAEVGRVVRDDCIIASNTSSLSIGKMAGYCGRPKQMVGMHFFNPVQLMKLVEVIRTDDTDPALFQRAYDFSATLGKTPIECIDTPGFVVNRAPPHDSDSVEPANWCPLPVPSHARMRASPA